jgi:hypothetical protein
MGIVFGVLVAVDIEADRGIDREADSRAVG